MGDDTMGEVTIEGDTATVSFIRDIAADVDRVWELLTDPGALATWLAPVEIALRLDGSIHVAFDDGAVTGRIVELDPPHRLAYTWLIEGEGESVVEWTLTPDGERTRLGLVHRTLPGTMGAGYGAGWHAHLDQLQAAGEGTAIPDWDERFGELIGVYATR